MTMRLLLLSGGLLLVAATALATSPTACTGTCQIQSLGAGYLAPVTEIASGAEVVWGSLDITHIQVQWPVVASDTCFVATATPSEDSVPVRFDLAGGSLSATTAPGTTSESTAACGDVQTLPDGSVDLAYYCAIHPNMLGHLLIRA